jgi:hypothetical protein
MTDMRTALTEHIRTLNPEFDDSAEVVANEVVAFVRASGYQLTPAREAELREFVHAKLTRTSMMYASALAALVVAELGAEDLDVTLAG